MNRRDTLKATTLITASYLLPVPLGSLSSAGKAASGPIATKPQTASAGIPETGALSIDRGWRFHLGDIPPSLIRGHEATYLNAKAGRARDAAAIDYDDSDWRQLDLPHDWAIELPAVSDENMSQGYRQRGIGWYRRAMRLEPDLAGKYLEIQFGGIATNATIWFNGNVVAHNWSGYSSVYIDITAMARFGDDLNSIVVRCDAQKMEGWWYEGAGIYRHSWLIVRDAIHIITDGIHADPRRAKDGSWSLPIEATLYNIGEAGLAVELQVELRDMTGAAVGQGSTSTTCAPLEQTPARLTIEGIRPKLWSIDDPNLYSVSTKLVVAGRVVDERITTCGFRTLRFDADTGFFLNDQPVKVKGVCIHQDHAGVGTAVPASLIDWRVRQIKAMGCNAIRSAHNAPDIALLDACDRYGILVLDENRLFNITPDYVAQLVWMVRRDRNHPCVFLWSVFNEEPVQATESGYQMVRRMVRTVKDLDESRPVIAAMSDGMFTPLNVSDALDIMGFNYLQKEYDRFHTANPTQPMMSSEDTAAIMTRGAWKSDPARQILADDDSEASAWGTIQRTGWRYITERPFVAGGFYWTAFDYHGEPTPHPWPAKSSYFGLMDLCGFPKNAYFLRQALWIEDRPVAALAPHWNIDARPGEMVKVMAITNGDAARLILNGRTVAEGPVDRHQMATFDVPYAPGRLEMIVSRRGRAWAHASVETAGPAVALRLTPDRKALTGDGRDAQPIMIAAVDARGRVVPTADHLFTIKIIGARVIGVGNGDPTGEQPSKGLQERLFGGLGQAIVQTNADSRIPIRFEVSAPGLMPAVLAIAIKPGTVPSVPVDQSVRRLETWYTSDILNTRPEPLPQVPNGNTVFWGLAGVVPKAASKDGYLLLTASLTPERRVIAYGGRLRMAAVTGRGSLWINGKLAAEKSKLATAPLEAAIPAGSGPHELALILESVEGERIGLPGVVVILTDDAVPS